MGGPRYKRSKSFSLQGLTMTVATPWVNMKLVPVTAHTCLHSSLGKQTQGYFYSVQPLLCFPLFLQRMFLPPS